MNTPIKILFVSQYFPPEMGAPSARTYELSRAWVSEGANVSVITAFPNHPTGIIPAEYKQHIYKIENVDGIKVIRTYVYPTANKGFFKRILSYFSFMISAILLGPWQTGKIDVVIATSPQFFVAIAGYIISRIKRKPFVFEVRDLWPESIIQLGQIKNKIVIKLLENLELFLYKKAALIVVVTDAFVDEIEKKGISREKIAVIKNGVDLSLFKPEKSRPEIKSQLELDQKFIVSYIGTHGLSHALDKVLQTAELLKKNQDIHFLLIGEGAEKEHLKRQKQQLSLDNVTFLDQIEKQMLPYYYSLSDIVLIPLKKLPLFQTVIPSKMFEIMAMAKPIILSVDGEARRIVVDEAKAGIFVEPENVHAMKKIILEFFTKKKNQHVLGENGRLFVTQFYNRDELASFYLVCLQKLL